MNYSITNILTQHVEVGLGLFMIVLHFLGIILVGYYKRRFLYLDERPLVSQLFCLIGTIINFVVIPYRDVYVGREYYSCAALSALNIFMIFFYMIPLFSNYLVYLAKLKLQKEEFKQRQILDQAKSVNRHNRRISEMNDIQYKRDEQSNITLNVTTSTHFLSQLVDFMAVWRNQDDTLNTELGNIPIPSQFKRSKVISDTKVVVVLTRELSSSKSDIENGSCDSKVTPAPIPRRKLNITSQRYMLEYIFPISFTMLLSIPIFIIVITRVLLDPLCLKDHTGCQLNYIDITSMAVGFFILSIYIGIVLHVTEDEPDPMGIRHEFLSSMVLFTPLTISTWILLLVDPNGYERNGHMSWQILQMVSGLIIIINSTYCRVGMAMYQRRMILLSDSIPLDLDAMLHDAIARKALISHCVNELSSENVLFLLDAQDWISALENGATRAFLIRDLSKLCDLYISHAGVSPINISAKTVDHIVKAVEELKKNPAKEVDSEILDNAIRECKEVVMFDTLPRLRKTKIFEKEIVKSGIIDKIISNHLQHRNSRASVSPLRSSVSPYFNSAKSSSAANL